MSKTNNTNGPLLGTNPNNPPAPKTQGGAVTTTTNSDVGNPEQDGGGNPNFEGTGNANTQQGSGNTQSGDFTVSSDSIEDDSYVEVNVNTQTQPTGDIRTKVQFDYEINANHFNSGDQVTVNFTPNNAVYNSSNVLLTTQDKEQLLDLGYDINFDYTVSNQVSC